MDAGLIAFIAGMIGLLVGVLSMNAVARSEREQERSLVSAPREILKWLNILPTLIKRKY